MKSVFSLIAMFSVATVQATVVEFRTNLGNIQVNLFDQYTPQTVENFLSYVNAGAYANNVVHRSEPGFVLQGGGYQYNGTMPLDTVSKGLPINNEPELSNVTGTIAMAKLGGDPNSATSQWFFNLSDNSANLDVQNGGFTVFGQVIGDGMQVLEAIEALPRFNLGGAATAMPLMNFTEADAANGVDITDEHLVLITDIVVIDDTPETNPDLNPTPNTLIDGNNNGSGGGDAPASGGGALTFLLFPLAGVLFLRRFQSARR